MMVILVESIVLCMLFSISSIMMLKDPLIQIHNYPPAIIERVIQLGLTDKSNRGRSKKTIIKKICAAILVGIIFALVVHHVNGASSFVEGFGYTYLLWAIVNVYDVVVLDIIVFCHCKRFVLPGTEDMVKDYHDYWFHIKGGFMGILYGLPVALIVGAFVALLA